MEKVKTVNFSETIAASDLKVGRCKQLIAFMKYLSIEGQGHLFTYITKFCIFCALLCQYIR